MGRTAAVVWHAPLSIVAAGLYFFFVLPRWPELMGQTSHTLGTVLRIITGALIGLAALPVVFTLVRTRRPEYRTPTLALRLRVSSIVLHVLAAVLIVGTAIGEIWLSLDAAGPWLFGVYGAAAAIALLGMFAFYLAFVAELPPPAPKPLKVREPRGRGRTAPEDTEAPEAADEVDVDVDVEDANAAGSDSDEATENAESTENDGEDAGTAASVTARQADDGDVDASDDISGPAEPEPDSLDADQPVSGGLRNRRPAGKALLSRRRKRPRGAVAIEDRAD